MSSFFISMPLILHAQSQPVMRDTLPMRPNTVMVIGVLKKIDSQHAKLKISQVVAQGAGIVNTLSAGDEIIVTLNEDTKKLLGVKIKAYLKEELGSDAAASRYIFIDVPLKLK